MALTENPDLIRSATGVAIARNSDDIGPPELHVRKSLTATDTNEAGQTRRVCQTRDTLQRLLECGTISARQEEAGRKFQRKFHAAHCRSRSWCLERVHSNGSETPLAELEAAEVIARALAALGGHGAPAADTMWYVVGVGYTLKDYAMLRHWTHRRQDASGALVSGLAILSRHWGL